MSLSWQCIDSNPNNVAPWFVGAPRIPGTPATRFLAVLYTWALQRSALDISSTKPNKTRTRPSTAVCSQSPPTWVLKMSIIIRLTSKSPVYLSFIPFFSDLQAVHVLLLFTGNRNPWTENTSFCSSSVPPSPQSTDISSSLAEGHSVCAHI